MIDFDLFVEPRIEALKKISVFPNEPEMSDFDSSFLCGLIKNRSPKKIVEVGIAAGGTTAIILQCLAMLDRNEDCEVYSVDLNEMFYRGTEKKSGFLAEELKDSMPELSFKHKVLLGKYLPEFIDEIGGDIDFLVLDTVHALPGEILDFLAIFPYLKADACVVLHDIVNNHYGRYPESFATQVLFDCVTADKCIVLQNDNGLKYPNIGAFFINNDTSKYIMDCFNALSITWSYSVNKDEYEVYRKWFEVHYDAKLISIFNIIYELQRNTRSRILTKEQTYKNNNDLQSSISYKIGRIITWLPRKIRKIWQK